MSLTSFLDMPNIRKMFSTNIPKPKIKIGKILLAPPLTKNYTIVGIAFDYLMRLYLKEINKNVIEGIWIAELLLKSPKSPILKNIGIDVDKGEITEYSETEITKFLKTIINNCKELSSNYLSTYRFTDELVASFILLSQFDIIFRSGKVFDIKNNVDKNDIADLMNMLEIIEKKKNLFLANEHCLLDPTFGEASRMIGGADVDLIIDNRIIDIKTTIKSDFNRDQFNQILGYYLLSCIGNIDGLNRTIKIEKIGVYYSRYGELIEIPIKSIVEEVKMMKFVDMFKKEIAEFKRKSK